MDRDREREGEREGGRQREKGREAGPYSRHPLCKSPLPDLSYNPSLPPPPQHRPTPPPPKPTVSLVLLRGPHLKGRAWSHSIGRERERGREGEGEGEKGERESKSSEEESDSYPHEFIFSEAGIKPNKTKRRTRRGKVQSACFMPPI